MERKKRLKNWGAESDVQQRQCNANARKRMLICNSNNRQYHTETPQANQQDLEQSRENNEYNIAETSCDRVFGL